jgi:glucokinase
MTLLLAADIGGTKTDLAIIDLLQKPNADMVRHKRYKNREFTNFEAILTDFLSNSPAPEYGCLGVAGVIRDNTAKFTNLDWILNQETLQKEFNLKKVWLINDLTAVCASLPLLQEDELVTIQAGQPASHGIQAVIAPGTGLGEGFLLNRENCLFAQGSEGGHCDFAPLTKEQEKLLSFMQQKYTAVSYELLCSGLGIPHIFDYFSTTDIPREPKRFALIRAAADKTPFIVEGAHAKTVCPLCEKTLSVFLEILGSEAGNLALKTYCVDGLFIGGGILPRLVKYISFAPFIENFHRKEKMTELMESIPVHVIMKNDAALRGSAHYGSHLYHSSKLATGEKP